MGKNISAFSLFLLVTLTVFTISCKHTGPVFEKYLKMKNYTWDRFDQKFFEIPIEETAKNVDITFIVRYNDKLAYNDLPLYIILTTPSGEERIREISIPIRENGRLVAVPKSDLYESRVVLWKNLGLPEKGNCKISIENMIPKIQTAGIDEIGIVVTKTD